jgi:galactonate dehydratase
VLERSSRRRFLRDGGCVAAAACAFPAVVRAQAPLSLSFVTIPDPDGWHPSLRLKGDWLVIEVSDGVLSGFGEASHSRDDEACKRAAAAAFERHYGGFALSLENLAAKEREIARLEPDFVAATALSGINQALYDLLAKREQVPVWRLFGNRAGIERVPLYATINRALQTRSNDEYLDVVGQVAAQGFAAFKCAPFETVDGPDDAIAKSEQGVATLALLRERFPGLDARVDFHERFAPRDFFALIPRLERLGLDWIEEPFALGPEYAELRSRTALRVACGELFWGGARFREIVENRWAHVIMPDVKHVGGFGPLLDVLDSSRGRVEVSPHNPSGPISSAASLHAAALFPDRVVSLEYAFDRAGTRGATGEIVERGTLVLTDRPGWGVTPA